MVYRLFDPTLDREVALKALHPELMADKRGRRRFVQEEKAAAAVHHQHIGNHPRDRTSGWAMARC